MAGLLAGCATSPSNHHVTAKNNVPRAPVSRRGTHNHPFKIQGPLYKMSAMKAHYTPHHWPSPKKDLWSQIRAGFKLKQHKDQRPVRVWTQFYATHAHHLHTALKRARPFLWHVVQQLEKRGMPTEIALLPIVESGYNPKAKSYMGASGLWQFMPGTADHMSLSRDWWYDGRDDPIASTSAALNYLQTLDQRYNGDWLLALAAYNAGPGRIDDAISKNESEGKPTDFWDLDLPEETTQYVPKLLALRWIMETPARFGVNWPELPNRPRTRVVKLPSQTSMKVAAHLLGMSESRLRHLNPGMRRWASEPGGHDKLLVPAAKASAFRSKLARISPARLIDRRTHVVKRGDVLSRLAHTYHVSIAALRQANHLSSNRIYVGQRLTIPRHGAAPAPARPNGPTHEYVVQSGDTLWGIAKRHDTRVARIEHINDVTAHSLHPGEKLKVPGSGHAAGSGSSGPTHQYVVQSGDTLWGIAHRFHTPVAEIERVNGVAAQNLHPGQKLRLPGGQASARRRPTTVVVKRGDTLWSIAQANNVTIADLRRWNRIGKGNPLKPGMTIAVDGPAPLPNFYQVEPGDSLWSIASRFSMHVNTLRDLNDLGDDATIQPGERLRLHPAVSG